PSSAPFSRFRIISTSINPRPEERARARVSKDGHGQDRASVHPSRRRASHGSSGCGLWGKLTLSDLAGFIESILESAGSNPLDDETRRILMRQNEHHSAASIVSCCI